jgi:hypothetical protein
MKGTNKSWRAQRGTRVRYAADRKAGTAVVVRVPSPPGGGSDGRYLIRDAADGSEREVSGTEIRVP